jgi:phage baseplate assembly protein W
MAERTEALQFPLRVDGVFGHLKQEADYERYVNQLIRQVLLTSPGERAHRPDFGAGLRRMVFQANDDTTASLLQTLIFQNLNQFLGTLISVDDVRARANGGQLDVTVIYTLKARGTRTVLNLEVTV